MNHSEDENIHVKINNHIMAYENMSLPVPPYRLTLQEEYLIHKQCKHMFDIGDYKPATLDTYMGVKIIVVVEIK